MELWRATQSLDSATDWSKTRRLQEIASLAEAELLKGGVSNAIYPNSLLYWKVYATC
jgi:4-hydroxy-2-oxoglutarate aldolase